ncbi:MAG: hypothetical protein JO189_04755, partial [Deltaproteobacteria bacterium]|nr:hypothetical protein [Deltaproteobacteria bacterium]
GMLEIRFAQLLAKLLPITSLIAYAVVFTFHRRLLMADAMFVIWGIYLGITAVLAATGLIQVFRLCGVPPIHFYLPKGFWRYSLDTQQVGLVSFLAGRLDYVLIINFGGLAMLGRYVAVTAVSATVPLMNGLIMDTLLPCLTNMIAARNYNAAVQVFLMHMRILFIVTMASCAAMTVLAVPAAAVMGPKYRSLVSLIILMTILQGIASPGFFGGILLASVGRQRLVNWAGLLYATVFSGLFFPLWHRWGLAGTVVAYGAAAIVSRWALMIIALKTAQIFPSIIVLWAKAALVQTAMGIVVLWCMPFRPFGIALVWIIGGAAFLRITGYSIAEVEALLQTFAPGFARIRTRRSESTREQSPEVAST